ncbi:conserved protein of unknown function (plasmid) [Rhodovastum atsumiense]|uniref:Uncharacterized protein n=1 Tax=Rhodovastum atsumiense TaxID=504468 RepID=A0A5M6ITJ9_9PROT|nr:hypothetical protein [Rhodovastum atsumiense]KAA5611646.1 hypothetical protein F1189_13885 [Rhodovastum atsumiense]CAH2606256.1 conserved protein of unknown function [Rhodovastum atsumiense]
MSDDPHDKETMALCAIRYTIGRRSYVVSDGARWARKWGAKSPWVRRVIIRDLESEVADIDADRAEGRRARATLGDAQDEREWRAVLADLKAMEAANVGA